MENLWLKIQSYLLNLSTASANPTLVKGVVVILILLLSQILKQFFFSVVFSRIEQLTKKTSTALDDEFIEILKPPLGWLLFFVALWFVQLILSEDLSPTISQTLNQLLELAIVSTIAYTLFALSPLLGRVIAALTIRTDTELDDLIVPYLPKLFQIAAILIVVLKGSEVLLGVSSNAIVGILGGAGIAFGLLIKDVIYDWCCTVIIYADNLYRTGDQLTVSNIDSPVEVLEIGLRSTKLGILDTNSIKKIPNSSMITGIVENRSQKIK
jgi:MscS family membrane protein